MSLLIQNGRLLDPASGTDQLSDLRIVAGKIHQLTPANQLTPDPDEEVLDASGLWVVPGLVDLNTQVCEPGLEYKEDIDSASRAAVAGGYTTLVTRADTSPALDHPEQVRFVKDRGARTERCHVLPTGALTAGLKGEQLAPFADLQRAGAVAVGDGATVANPQLMRSALEYARDFDLTVFSETNDPALALDGSMNEGTVSTRLGLRGIPEVAESSMVARDILLAEFTGGRLHLSSISTARSVELVRAARGRGVNVTAGVAAHHLLLTEEAVEGFSTAAKVLPPLRSEADQKALIEGIKDGALEVITSGHSPESSIEKDLTFRNAEFGALGLQTAAAAALALHHEHGVSPLRVIECLSFAPARLLGLSGGRIEEGQGADLALVDPELSWEFTLDQNQSKSRNSPFWGRTFRGRVTRTMFNGTLVFSV